jgi:ubiquinone/menaquinone biosynthesis C-methylase UbiE
VTARYDEIADFYDGKVGDDLSDSAALALLDLLGDVHGRRMLDLACGQGRVSRELARRGASVVAVDISERLLEKARALEANEPLGIEYRKVDATSPQDLASEEFDGAVCHFGLSDIDELGAALATVARALRADGFFVFSILHPCFPGWGEDAPSSWPPAQTYYSEGWWLADNPGFRGKVGTNHRTLSTYLNELFANGLAPERVEEPAHGDWPVPTYLVVRCRRR